MMTETDSEFLDYVKYVHNPHSPLTRTDLKRLIVLARRGAAADNLEPLLQERDALREQDEAIRAEFGGKRDGRPTIECLREAFAAKWSEEDTLFQATLDMKTEELRSEIERLRAGGCARDQKTTQYCAEVARLAAENEKLRAEVQKLDSECTDLATDLSTQRQDNASLAEPWKVVNPLRAENEKLRTALNLIRKTYPADNARLIHNAHQIIAIAITALQDKSDEPPEGKAAIDGEHEASKP